MTIIAPKSYPLIEALRKRRIVCISEEKALTADIRALRVGILNIMPQAEKYEFSLLHPLGRSIMQIEPVWIRLETHTYSSTDKEHLDSVYVTFEEAVSRRMLDGLVVTGAPVEDIPFEQISYWDEIQRILRYAHRNVTSTLGICWGGMALAKYMGIEKKLYSRKLFGIYETRSLYPGHRITGEMDDLFWCPQSRHSGIPDEVLESLRDQGKIRLLAHAGKAGYTIFESEDQRFLAHLGHPEYDAARLVEEYERDLKLGRKDVDPPENVDLEEPATRWRGHRNEFFSEWIRFIHETTTY